jgi:hypothetical protein
VVGRGDQRREQAEHDRSSTSTTTRTEPRLAGGDRDGRSGREIEWEGIEQGGEHQQIRESDDEKPGAIEKDRWYDQSTTKAGS